MARSSFYEKQKAAEDRAARWWTVGGLLFAVAIIGGCAFGAKYDGEWVKSNSSGTPASQNEVTSSGQGVTVYNSPVAWPTDSHFGGRR